MGGRSPLDERSGPRLCAILKSMSYMEKCLVLDKLSTGDTAYLDTVSIMKQKGFS